MDEQIEIKRKKRLKLLVFLFFVAIILLIAVGITIMWRCGTDVFENYNEHPRETALYVLSAVPAGIIIWAIGGALNPNKKFWATLIKIYGILVAGVNLIGALYFLSIA